jgi:membrane protein DedA with SNARE-associated domain
VPLASVSSTLTTLVGDHGLYAVFGLMAIDAVLPAASELVMLYAGAVAAGAFAGQHVSLFGSRIPFGFDAYLAMALAGALGYLLGAIAGWAIGYYGDRRFRVSERKLAKARLWFDRWDDWAVFLGRVTPVARSFVSIPAGIFRMPLPRYTALTAAGSAIWCFAFAGAGWAVGRSWERFHHDFRFVDYAVVAVIVLVAGWLLLRWRAARRARLAAE